ncbi:unnamed protein product [Heligmosomoides polygyrus]|uniref:Endo/exonuclease/phosphatase domain-containing protein n=1 Tax=Heligmosomoides polygyrus TaxID=6339 RepID=A0A183FQ69_HELPZ|nr:unnamed protein product [Heligmosomoides polygyrus]
MRGRHRGATEPVRKSRNVSRTRVAKLNVGTLTGRSCELRQETRCSCRKSRDIGRGFKAVLSGSPSTTGGVGMIVSERFRNAIVSVKRFDYRLMKIIVAAKEGLYHFFSAHAPQSGCYDQGKEEFWSLLDEKTAAVPPKDVIIVAGDLNGHVGAPKDGYSCNGGLVTLMTVAPQHRPLIYTLKIAPPTLKQIERCGAARIKWWRVKEKEAAVISRVRLPTVTIVDETWNRATDAIRQAAREELGTTKYGRRKVDMQTWLWTDDVKAKVREKKSRYHVFLGDKIADNWQKPSPPVTESSTTAVPIFRRSDVPINVTSDYDDIFRRHLSCLLIKQAPKLILGLIGAASLQPAYAEKK